MNSFFSFLHLFVQFFFSYLGIFEDCIFDFDFARKIKHDRENSFAMS